MERDSFVCNPNSARRIKRLSDKEKCVKDSSNLLIGVSGRQKIDQKLSGKERVSFKVVDITSETNFSANNFANILQVGLNNKQNGKALMTWCESGEVDNFMLFVLYRMQN